MVSSEDPNYDLAAETWKKLILQNEELLTNNYVLTESIALIQHRIGIEAISVLHNNIIPFMKVEWLDESMHNIVMGHVIAGNRRHVSMVDHSCFETMRRHNVRTAFRDCLISRSESSAKLKSRANLPDD